jgi:hypothetical protein
MNVNAADFGVSAEHIKLTILLEMAQMWHQFHIVFLVYFLCMFSYFLEWN